jgi:Putative type VII ESX secretion system translocon, EccE
VGSAAAGLFIGLMAKSVPLAVVLSAPGVALAWLPVSGLYAVDWTPVIIHWLLRRSQRQTRYRAQLQKPRPVGTLALPGDAASLRAFVDPTDHVCLIHDPHRATVSATLRVTHPAYVLLSPDAQHQRVTLWGRAIASLERASGCAGVKVLEATIPDSGAAIADYYQEYGAGRGGWAEQQYETLLASKSRGASTHRTTLTLTLDMRKASAAVKAAGGGVKGASRVLHEDMEVLETVLRAAELKISHWLGEGEIAQMTRVAYDLGVGGELEAEAPGANLAHAGPLSVDELWDRLHHDSGWSRVLWISEWPRIESPAHMLHSVVFAPGVRKTLCMTLRPKRTDEALKQILRQKGSMEADDLQKRKLGQVERLSDAQEYHDVVRREQALNAGHADVEFTGWIVVSASEEDQLDLATKQIERAAGQAGCETRVLYGRQAQAFAVAALPTGTSTL